MMLSVNVHMCTECRERLGMALGSSLDDKDEKDEENKVVEDDDKDNVIGVMFNLKKRKNKKSPKKLKNKVKAEDDLPSIRTRTSPNKLYEAVRVMNKWQREIIKEMGFGQFLGFHVSEVIANLGHYVVDMLDTESMKIQIGDRYIRVEKESVRKILGLPLGETRVAKKKKVEPGNPLKEKWTHGFAKLPISFKNIVDKIRVDPYEDRSMFDIDFVMLLLSTMIVCTKTGV
ncbi:hypothetical protein Hdeb2414_s0012g00387591 [Helianthus debilis subsp. tardiflorus]